MINVNVGHNSELLESCKPLYDVSEFVSRVRENRAQGYSKEDAVEMAVNSCIEDNVLGDIVIFERACDCESGDDCAAIEILGIAREMRRSV